MLEWPVRSWLLSHGDIWNTCHENQFDSVPVLPCYLFGPRSCPRILHNSHSRTNISFSDALDADNYGGVATSDAVAGLAYHFSGHDYLDVPGLDVSPRAFPELTVGAWVKVGRADRTRSC